MHIWQRYRSNKCEMKWNFSAFEISIFLFLLCLNIQQSDLCLPTLYVKIHFSATHLCRKIGLKRSNCCQVEVSSGMSLCSFATWQCLLVHSTLEVNLLIIFVKQVKLERGGNLSRYCDAKVGIIQVLYTRDNVFLYMYIVHVIYVVHRQLSRKRQWKDMDILPAKHFIIKSWA